MLILILFLMPEPYAVMREKIKKRLRGKSGNQRIRELENILDGLIPIYKPLINELRQELEFLKSKKSSKSHRGSTKYHIQKKSPQITITGYAESSKLLLFQKLANKQLLSSGKKILLTNLNHKHVHIQVVLSPNIYDRILEYDHELCSLIKSTDGLLFVVDENEDFQRMVIELEKTGIRPYNGKKKRELKYKGKGIFLPSIIAYEKKPPITDLPVININNIERLKDEIYESLGITRVYLTKTNKQGFIKSPLVFMKDYITVEDVTGKIGFPKLIFRYAKIWGSAKFEGEMVGLKRQLFDGDIVRIYRK